ncbi:protease modulator HflC [Clostridium boliviensis]|uniref:Protein HflC n=1 Tax=Clostridium boliviensis TaxID=318465 RepID=A0ABU4GQ46_9CLOT|nr:protease modulator HflC [Clostridium boliviensis]MDW2799102.1 protease modulator HflC [Clostridium boliviensis]
MKKIKTAIGILITAAVLIVLTGSVVVTNENEYKLIRQFGRVERVISTPGISFKIPLVQTAYTLPKQILLYDLAASDVITMDKKTMLSDSYVLWRIEDPLKFAQSLNSSVISAESRIDTVVYNSVKNVISSMAQNEVISGRDGELSQAIMENAGDNMVQYGIRLLSVETKRLDLPADNKTAVYERMISERAKIAATFTAEGQAEAKKIQNTTDREIAISISDAQAKAASITAEGEGEYMRILAEAYHDPQRTDFYSFVRSLEAARTSLSGNGNTLILPESSPLARIFTGQ